MVGLDKAPAGSTVRVGQVEGNVRLATRLASVGIVPGSTVEVRRNDPKRPVLIFERDTTLAINRAECASILVEEVL